MARRRADSGRVSSLDASLSGDDASSAGDDGGALDALWRFEEAHHCLLHQQLAPAHAAFVDGLYAALEAARDALEQQSVRVLAVLHDKDKRIEALESETARRRISETVVDVATQCEVRTKSKATQCEPTRDGTREEENDEEETVMALRRQVDEQGEQIEVLLDELERMQRLVEEAKTDANKDATDEPRRPTDSKAVQTTDTQGILVSRGGGDAQAMITALQAQLDEVERNNTALRTALSQTQTPPPQAMLSTDADLDAVDVQLEDAIRVMETVSQCRLNPLTSTCDGATLTCLDLEHKLRDAELERDSLVDQILALHKALSNGTAMPSFVSTLAVLESNQQQTLEKGCNQVTCHHTLRRLIQQVRSQRSTQSERDTKALRREIRHALRSYSNEEAAKMVGRIAAEWMRWESVRVEELNNIRRAHADQLAVQSTRMAALVDEIHRLNQRSLDLETELKVLSRQSSTSPVVNGQNERASGGEMAMAVDKDRHVLMLEQSLMMKQEQLDVANRAVRALSSTVGSHALSVRFADEGVTSGREIVQHRSSLPASNAKTLVAELTMELQALKERDCKRFFPASTSQHAVVEYFRLEKECLRLRCRLRDKDDRIQQLELHCGELEKSARRICTLEESQEALRFIEKQLIEAARMGDYPKGVSQHGIIERYYVRVLEKRNEDLRVEIIKAKSRISFLERSLNLSSSSHSQPGDLPVTGKLELVQRAVKQVEEYHMQAQEAMQEWKQKWQDKSSTKEAIEPRAGQPDQLLASYGVLLGHYETLSLQLQMLQNASGSDLVSRTDDSKSATDVSQLLGRIHVLEDRLLEAQACLGCGDRVVKQLVAKTVNVGIATDGASTVETGTQVSSRDRHKMQLSKGIQTDSETAPFQHEEPQGHISNRSSLATAPPMVEDGRPESSTDSRLLKIQHHLEMSLARVEELTAQKDKLAERLDDARRANRRLAKEEENLRSQVAEMESSNASLSNELHQLRHAEPITTPSIEASTEKTLAVKEQETCELVRQLCESKERCFQVEKAREDAELRVRKLEEMMKSLEADRIDDRNRHLEEYMAKVNQSLASFERDKERLMSENQELQRKLQQLEVEAAAKAATGTRTSATETDSSLELDRLLQLPEHQALETRVVLLQNELEIERRAHAELRTRHETEQRERSRAMDAERIAVDDEKASLRRLMDEITAAHERLQQELVDLQAASVEAREEADKRIQFLTACVEECSRLVDAAGPNDDIITSRDIYDTIVTLSTRIASGVRGPATTTPRRSKTAVGAKPSENKAPNSMPLAGSERPQEKPDLKRGIQVHSQLQAETWRVRAAKLEASLRAASLKTKTFEDMVDHLEVQMDALKGEVKDRMAKESMLLTKHGQLKVEITTLKAQNHTLTSRLAEACGELKRTQDAAKGTDGEVARLRAALQRKTELLSRHKSKCDDTQSALELATKRIAQLELAEKHAAAAMLKHKDQAQQLQELRQQWTASRDANAELRAHADAHKLQLGELQARVKSLRLDNGQLRDQLRSLKKTVRDQAEAVVSTHHADTATALAAVGGDGRVSPATPIDLLAAQVKTLKRRVLQKQEVIVAFKTKLTELAAALESERATVAELSQSYRHVQQSQRDKERRLLEGATLLQDELERALRAKTEQLDGLRASVFDACEVFVACSRGPVSSSSSSASLTWPEDPEDDGVDGHLDTHKAELLQELRRYADLSPADLADLRITTVATKSQRLDRVHAAHVAQQRGARVLQELEHALEASPHDCRDEIGAVLAFLARTG